MLGVAVPCEWRLWVCLSHPTPPNLLPFPLQAVVASGSDIFDAVFNSGAVMVLLAAVFRAGLCTHATSTATSPSSSLSRKHKDVMATATRILRLIAISPLPASAPDANGVASTVMTSLSRYVPLGVLRGVVAAASPVEAFDVLHTDSTADGCVWNDGCVSGWEGGFATSPARLVHGWLAFVLACCWCLSVVAPLRARGQHCRTSGSRGTATSAASPTQLRLLWCGDRSRRCPHKQLLHNRSPASFSNW